MTEFVHLNIHTEFSLIDGLSSLDELTQRVADQSMTAIALTDQMNLFGLVKFYRACLSHKIKPIVGASVYLANDQEPNKPYQAILLCQNAQGYRHLSELISQAYLHGQEHGKAILQRPWLIAKNQGLLMLSGAQYGDIGQALLSQKPQLAATLLEEWLDIFGDRFYLELQRVGHADEETYIQQAIQLALQCQVAVVATNPVRFLKPDDFDAHEAKVAIYNSYTLADPKRPKNYTRQQYFRSAEEMRHLFRDLPAALQNSLEIAKRCTVELVLGKIFLPQFPVPAGMTIEDYLIQVAQQGLGERLANLLDNMADDYVEQQAIYQQRLEAELTVITKMGFAGYFLIVADFIQWAKDHGIPVGPGRGSGAGSLVAYVLKITDLDPLRYDLLFERFLNPERVSMPDFDIDFCMEGRDRVIDYVARKYGREAVSQIITYGTMAAKAVIRDVGRVLGHPYGFVDKLAKLIPFELGITLDKALQQDEVLRHRYQTEEDVASLIDLAKKLEGKTRNVGKHAGGVVIAPSKLTDFAPIYCESGETSILSQFDKDDIEAIGLVKFDFLGLRTLTIIDWAIKNIAKSCNEVIDINTISLEDEATFSLLKSCLTTAVFQLESRGMKDLIRRLQPDCFEDIVALVALFRPGPLQSGMVDDFIDRKHGRAPIEYSHPNLTNILKPTYGVILYQEQVMQIAQVLANYTLGAADLLRRAMGKKKPEEMAKQRLIFVEGSVACGVDKHTATHIFDLMEKFAGYGFNKSHSAAYALLSYQTAWLKIHYPAEFMAAVLSSDMDNTDKVVNFAEDCKQIGIELLPPDINQSEIKFTVKDNKILYGLGAIKGAGEAALSGIIAEREENGPYNNLFEFCHRMDLRKVNRRVLEALIKSGALDSFGIDRATLSASLEKALHQAEQHSRDQGIGQADLFGADMVEIEAVYIQASPWRDKDRLAGEKEMLGLYFTGHPLQRYKEEFKHFTTATISELQPTRSQRVRLAGMIVAIRTMNTKRGDRMGFISLDDGSGRIELAVFSDVYQQYREYLTKDNLLIVEGDLSMDNYTGGFKMSANNIWTLDQARQRFAKSISIHIENKEPQVKNIIHELQNLMRPYQNTGNCPIIIAYHRPDASARFHLGEEWRVQPTDDLLDSIQELLGQGSATIEY